MCIAVVGLLLEALTLTGAILASLNHAWEMGDEHGGLWKYCPSGNVSMSRHDCLAYEAEEAESLNHVWPEIQAARATIILAMIFAVPLLIILLISMCNFCCTYAPYGAASVFAVIQLISIIAGCALMTHGFVTREEDAMKVGLSLWMGWAACFFCFFLVLLLFVACCPLCKPDREDTRRRRHEAREREIKLEKLRSREFKQSQREKTPQRKTSSPKRFSEADEY